MPNAVFNQMENKQHSTVILPKESFENEFERFIRDATNETGVYIVENAVNEMTAQGVDTSILVDGETPEIAEVSYNTKRKENYIYKIREDELKNATMSTSAYDELMAKINANLDEQDRKNCWRNFPKIISRTEHLKASQMVFNTDATAYADILKAIRADIRKIKKPTDIYNAYTKTVGDKTYTLKTFSNRPIVFIKSELLDAIEIDYQAGVSNLDKIRLDAEIIRVPEFYKVNEDFDPEQPESDENPKMVVDDTKLWLTCGFEYAKIYKHFEKRVSLEDVRSFNIGKAVTYNEYCSKLVPAIMHFSGADPNEV